MTNNSFALHSVAKKVDPPLVSVIIPAYNADDYVLAAIESCLDQTYDHIEIIVIDDGSTDETRKRIENLIQSNSIRYQYQPNRGLSAARNAGIRLAAGKYLQFLDADDLLLPEKIERQVECLEKTSEPTISCCDFRSFNDADLSNLYDGDIFKGEFPLHDAERLFEFDTFPARWLFPASLVDLVDGFDESMPATEDWLMLWKVLANGARIIYLDEPLALYRKHDRNMTRDFARIAFGHLLAIERVEHYQKQLGLRLYSKRELDALRESFHYEFGLHHLRQNKVLRAGYHFGKALLLSPQRRQPKLLLLAGLPVMKRGALDWAKSADARLWRWRAQLRRTFIG